MWMCSPVCRSRSTDDLPTHLLMVEHDARFLDNVAGKRIALEKA